MKSFKITIALLSAFLVIQSGCDELLSEDISNKEVTIISPYNNSILSNNEVRFLWEPVGGATFYHLQIVEPKFDQAQSFLVDTTTIHTNYIINLPSGNYEWRLLGSNGYYETDYKYFKFSIELDVDSTKVVIRDTGFDYTLSILQPDTEKKLVGASPYLTTSQQNELSINCFGVMSQKHKLGF